ncbi:MAG: acVLRF1 family peptidyl-tRNA hydrolase [Propionicimonas sp.]
MTSTGPATTVLVPTSRLVRWLENFEHRHGATHLEVVDGGLSGQAADGSDFAARLPFDTTYGGVPEAGAFAAAAREPDSWGVLLVRKGGFAVARVEHGEVVGRKVGRRHVQGRTKAGGQSQQRFARRRDNQARQAFEAAADHAVRILARSGNEPLSVVTGGDRAAVTEVLTDPQLSHVVVVPPWLPLPDPRATELDRALADARALSVTVRNADPLRA